MNFWNNLPKPSLHPFTIITIMTLTTTITQPFTITSQPPVEARHTFGNQQKTTAVWLQCAWPLLEFRHWGVLGGAPVYTDTLQHLPVSSRGQLHPAWKLATFNLKHRWLSVRTPPLFFNAPINYPYTQ